MRSAVLASFLMLPLLVPLAAGAAAPPEPAPPAEAHWEKIPLNYNSVAAIVDTLGGTLVPALGSTAPATGNPVSSGPFGAPVSAMRRDLVPDGIQAIVGYRSDNSLIIRGTPEAISALRRLIVLLDIPAKQVRVRLAVGHLTAEGQGTNGGSIQLSDAADGGRLNVVAAPRINGDGTVSLELSGTLTVGGEPHPVST